LAEGFGAISAKSGAKGLMLLMRLRTAIAAEGESSPASSIAETLLECRALLAREAILTTRDPSPMRARGAAEIIDDAGEAREINLVEGLFSLYQEGQEALL